MWQHELNSKILACHYIQKRLQLVSIYNYTDLHLVIFGGPLYGTPVGKNQIIKINTSLIKYSTYTTITYTLHNTHTQLLIVAVWLLNFHGFGEYPIIIPREIHKIFNVLMYRNHIYAYVEYYIPTKLKSS